MRNAQRTWCRSALSRLGHRDHRYIDGCYRILICDICGDRVRCGLRVVYLRDHGNTLGGTVAEQISRAYVYSVFWILSDNQGEDRKALKQDRTVGTQGAAFQRLPRYFDARRQPDPDDRYARLVCDGGNILRACQRHVRDIRHRADASDIPLYIQTAQKIKNEIKQGL